MISPCRATSVSAPGIFPVAVFGDPHVVVAVVDFDEHSVGRVGKLGDDVFGDLAVLTELGDLDVLRLVGGERERGLCHR